MTVSLPRFCPFPNNMRDSQFVDHCSSAGKPVHVENVERPDPFEDRPLSFVVERPVAFGDRKRTSGVVDLSRSETDSVLLAS